jgi:hypothetical protein
MGIYETRREQIKDEDGTWWVSHPKWTTLVEVKKGLITSIAPIKKKWLGHSFKSFIGKESFGRKDFRVRKIK